MFAESIESSSGACRFFIKAIGSLPSTIPAIDWLDQVLSGVPMEGIEVAISKIHHLASIISDMY